MEVGRSSFGNSEASSDMTEMDLPTQGRKRVNNNNNKTKKKKEKKKRWGGGGGGGGGCIIYITFHWILPDFTFVEYVQEWS